MLKTTLKVGDPVKLLDVTDLKQDNYKVTGITKTHLSCEAIVKAGREIYELGKTIKVMHPENTMHYGQNDLHNIERM